MCEKCAKALQMLIDEFGSDDAHCLLWNATSYPFSEDLTLKQVEELVQKHKAGKTVGQLIREVEDEMDALMQKYNEEHRQREEAERSGLKP